MPHTPSILAIDLEGVLVPEIWIEVAQRTGIPELRRTTRDEPNYDTLMRSRLEILDRHHIRMSTIQDVIAGMDPLPGALEFLDWARSQAQVVILSDTYYQFAEPLMIKLGRPTLFCHTLEVEADGRISGYHLRIKDHKRLSTEAFRQVNFRVCAIGDSYNDTAMLKAAHKGILFCPSAAVKADFPQFTIALNHRELTDMVHKFLES